jgi:hypothetical protein
MPNTLIEIAQADAGWAVRWNDATAATFPDTAAAVSYARDLSSTLEQGGCAPRIRVYFSQGSQRD